MELKRKVLAYITKGEGANLEILVFEHKDNPSAGTQVPGGTIEKDELLIDALYREVEEESGITRDELILKGKVKKMKYYPEHKSAVYERNIFHFLFVGKERSEWEHRVESDGADNGLIFCLRWVPIKELPALAVDQDKAIVFI
ncbi:NUDIX domain-containing protein [Filibacter tadaridae]|uniref:Bifunctional nicotinamide mononucleotide adenylyltransferase/ADP-ribose pyrophosphatase n=1 Tax=Filibacter tadaridae TaxID=2483811 RepID=A0A3P5WTS4_9BACL|nr:NUDIX domain-containing protein [Filibacter tadaridae]VDC22590.1 bifunctional nicotinamide mononucleotide adenylyltransferase/ADP-ribose pyrophosphatase [Filibacter tadaridae]